MLKKKQEEAKDGGNHQADVSGLLEVVEAFKLQAEDNARLTRELIARVEEAEAKKDAGGQAKLFMAQHLFNTPIEHLSEMTKLAVRSVRMYSLGDMSASVLDPDVQMGDMSLQEVRRVSYYRHMRSVGGDLMNKGSDLAMEQMRATEQEEPYDQSDLGKGL